MSGFAVSFLKKISELDAWKDIVVVSAVEAEGIIKNTAVINLDRCRRRTGSIYSDYGGFEYIMEV